MGSTTIHVSLGQVSYVGGTITETSGKDITGATIVMALGSYSTPLAKTVGRAPDSDEPGATTASRVVRLLIDGSYQPAAGQYVWGWITDAPEIEPVRLDGPITID